MSQNDQHSCVLQTQSQVAAPPEVLADVSIETKIPFLIESMLVVAPEGDLRSSLTSTFGDFGTRVVRAERYAEALAILERDEAIDIIVLEVPTPISSCFDFIRQVRARDPNLPPIFIVSDHVLAHFSDAYFEGAAGIFVKPLDLQEFTTAIALSYSEILGHPEREFERRRLERTRVEYTVGSEQASGFVTDISLGGMFIGTMDWMPMPNQKITFNLASEKGGFRLTGKAVVKWTRSEIAYGRPRGFGIEFCDVDRIGIEKIFGRKS